ncbi:MAG: AAA family ATPase, partial [Saccharofermentanales bacterium]
MYVKTLRLFNFRNYRDVTVELDSDTVVFYGQNAQGKTNLLEAIYLCSCLRSHRTYRDSDLITHGESEYSVGLDFIETAEDNTEYSGFNENISVAYFDTVSKDAS